MVLEEIGKTYLRRFSIEGFYSGIEPTELVILEISSIEFAVSWLAYWVLFFLREENIPYSFLKKRGDVCCWFEMEF